MKWWTINFLFIVFLTPAAPAQECLEYNDYLHVQASRRSAGGGKGVALDRDRIYAVNPYEGLVVLALQDSGEPVLLGSVELPGSPWAVQCHGNLVYISESGSEVGQAAFHIVDVTQPEAPQILGSLPLLGSGYGFSVQENLAFISDNSVAPVANLVRVVDVSDPQAPVILSSLAMPDMVTDMQALGDLLFVTVLQGLRVVDISDPLQPSIVGMMSTPHTAMGIDIAWPYAYVASSEAGLAILDLGTLPYPLVVGVADTPGRAMGVSVVGNRAYVADGTAGLQVVDVTVPSDPQLLGGLDLVGGDSWFLACNEQWVVLNSPVLSVIPTSANDSVHPLGFLPASALLGDIRLENGLGYLAVGVSGLQIVDLGDPSQPELLATLDTPGAGYSLALLGSQVLVADGYEGVQVVDVSDPYAPRIVRQFDSPGYSSSIAASNSTAYVANGMPGFAIIDLLGSGTPIQVVGERQTMMGADVLCHDNLLLLLEVRFDFLVSRLTLYDLADPRVPVVLGSCEMDGWGRGMTVQGDQVVVALGYNGLGVVDIFKPLEPALMSTMTSMRECQDVYLEDSVLYILDAAEGLLVASLEDPATPFLIGSFPWLGWNSSIYVNEGLVGFLALSDGLFLFPTQCELFASGVGDDPLPNGDPVPTLVGTLGNHPNPFNPSTTIAFSVAHDGEIELAVYDLAGHCVTTLLDGFIRAGSHEVPWNGRDQAGRIAAAGMYFVQLRDGNRVVSRKITMVK